MRVTAVVISFNTEKHVIPCLISLLEQTYEDLDIVFIDNNSADNSVALARRYEQWVEVVANWTNKGFAGAANQGISYALENDPDANGAVFVMNPDVRLEPDHIEKLVKRLESDPKIASVQGKLYRMDMSQELDEFVFSPQAVPAVPVKSENGLPIIDTTGHSAHKNRVFRNRGEGEPDTNQYHSGPVFGVSGCAALYRLSALMDIAINGEIFDEDFFAFFEDLDIDWRLRSRGYSAWHEESAVGLHERGGTGSRRSGFVERLSYRNWFLLVLKNDDWYSALPNLHLLGATTALRSADIAIHVPKAFIGAIRDSVLIEKMLEKRKVIKQKTRVDNGEIVDKFFHNFNYVEWIRRRLQRKRRSVS